MKVKEWFKTLFSGMAIGFGSAVPGVSGGTIAVIFGVYEKIIWAVSNIFKHFKEAFRVLLPTLLGVVLALIPTIYLMDKALYGFVFGVICIFAGFIIGSIPGITDEVKDVKPRYSHIIALVVAALVAIGLGVGSVLAKADVSVYFFGHTPWWFYLVLIPVGFVASVALVVPGLSGGMLLLLMGFYKPLITYTTDTAKACLHGDWSAFGSLIGILGCFLVGVILGFFFVSKLMHFLLAKYHDVTFYAIIGFVVGSVVALFFNYEIYSYYQVWASGTYIWMPLYVEIPIGVVLLIGACIASYFLVRYKRKKELESKEKEVPAE